MSERCVELVYSGSWGGSRCTKPAKVLDGTTWHCGTHSDAARQRRRARHDERSKADSARWKAQGEARREPWNLGNGKGWTDKRGYRWRYVVEDGKRVTKREHRIIMEEHIGRRLHPEELVHHTNGDIGDNRIENLQIMQWDEHATHHKIGVARTEQEKRRQAVLARYREEDRRVRRLNSTMLAALEAAEWAGEEPMGPYCPVCRHQKPNHLSDTRNLCPLGAAIAAARSGQAEQGTGLEVNVRLPTMDDTP